MPSGIYIRTKKHNENMSKAKKGNKNSMYGKKHSNETKLKIGKSNSGEKNAWYGKKRPEHSEKMKGVNNPFYGKHHTIESKLKISLSEKGEKNHFYGKKRPEHSERMKGTKNPFFGRYKEFSPNWQGGKSFEKYTTDWTQILKRSIRERDNYTCQLCNKQQGDNVFHVHHIDYDKKNCNQDNLITLCKRCHMKTNHNRKKWIKYFEILNEIKKLFFKIGSEKICQ